MAEWSLKIKAWRHRGTIEAELQEEIRLHLEMKTSATGDESGAHRRFGNTTLVLEDCREAWGWPRVEGWLRDLRYGFRVMVRGLVSRQQLS